MKTYRVVAKVSGIVFADIKAENEKEARQLPPPKPLAFEVEACKSLS